MISSDEDDESDDEEKAREEMQGFIAVSITKMPILCGNWWYIRVRPRFFDQIGHETMYATSGNMHFFTKSCHHQTYQNYEQSRQKLGTILENKVS